VNLETRLDTRLWQAIETNYASRDYTGAISDAIYFLSELIREKSGLESDGAALVGQAFGGPNPPLKVNRLETESETNVQKGVEQLLRGVYQAIRNPRSHEKHADTVEDADAIILFIGYLLKIIDQSKTAFTKAGTLARVFDPMFVAKERYADLIVQDIPERYRRDIFIDTFRKKEEGNGQKLKYFFASLLKVLKEEEQREIFSLISEELSTTDSEATIRMTIQIMPSEYWPRYGETARLRIENKLIESIREGLYNAKEDKCIKGSLGTWVTTIAGNIDLKSDLANVIAERLLTGNPYAEAYVFQYNLYGLLPELQVKPSWSVEKAIKKGLAAGNGRYQEVFSWLIEVDEYKTWVGEFKGALESFKERPKGSKFDDLDDDIPF